MRKTVHIEKLHQNSINELNEMHTAIKLELNKRALEAAKAATINRMVHEVLNATNVKKARFAATTEFGGGCLQGYVNTSYTHLVELFGEPGAGDGYKVAFEWAVKDSTTGKIYSIYDWKSTDLYDDHCPSPSHLKTLPIYDWHIGGNDKIGADALARFIAG